MGTHVVRLMKNHIYPTYQFHAWMANGKTTPGQGLRIGALTVMHWLCSRLGENTPEQLKTLPDIEDYKNVTDSELPSLHVNQGYVIDIVSMPQNGLWCLQITEPDLGSDPGNAEQKRTAVAGRVIETNIAFQIVGKELECGFMISISDPDGVLELAEVYRPAVVRSLIRNPDFGLRQLFPITENSDTTTCQEDCKTILSFARASENQLPIIIFTPAPIAKVLNEEPAKSPFGVKYGNFTLPPLQAKASDDEIPYATEAFSRSCAAFAKVYELDTKQVDKFKSLSGIRFQPGDIIVMEPTIFGGKTQLIPLKPSMQRRVETLNKLKTELKEYPRGKEYSFGRVRFISAARKNLLQETEEAARLAQNTSEAMEQEILKLKAIWEQELNEKDKQIEELSERLARHKDEIAKVEREKADLRTECEAQIDRERVIIAERDEQIAFLQRKLDQPGDLAGIAAWAEKHFSDRILLHSRAISELQDKALRNYSAELICDAIDYLATDYWERRYCGLSEEEAITRCSQKYDRPFEIIHTTGGAIEMFPTDYKIKYYLSYKGKPVESALDYHLKSGVDAEKLLHIYFLHDDDKKLIVIGSLPKHLRVVTIK